MARDSFITECLDTSTLQSDPERPGSVQGLHIACDEGMDPKYRETSAYRIHIQLSMKKSLVSEQVRVLYSNPF